MNEPQYTLAELMIMACADAFRGNGEILASGIGTLPRLGLLPDPPVFAEGLSPVQATRLELPQSTRRR